MRKKNCFQIKILNQIVYPKMGEELSDCQDALEANCDNNRFSVADGVSRSFYPAIFAQKLSHFFCHSDDPVNSNLFESENWEKWLGVCQQQWLYDVQQLVEKSNKYYIRNRFNSNEHAGATFAGIEFYQKNQSIYWDAMIIGDSCLIHFDKPNHQTNSYLMHSSKDFNFTPQYFPSRFVKDNPFKPEFLIKKSASKEDIFIIATDAISKWLLMLIEKTKSDVASIAQKISEKAVDKFRTKNTFPIENDDIALLVIQIV